MTLTPYRAWLACPSCKTGFEADVDSQGNPENDACPMCGERMRVKGLAEAIAKGRS